MNNITYYFDNVSSTELYSVDQELLKDYIKRQIEYYFSVDDLERDFFLRRKMDADDFLPITLIASFHRVQALTTDISLIFAALKDSNVVEIVDEKVCRREEPEKWPLPGPPIVDYSQTDFSQLLNCLEFVPHQHYQVSTTKRRQSRRLALLITAEKSEEPRFTHPTSLPRQLPSQQLMSKDQDDQEELDFRLMRWSRWMGKRTPLLPGLMESDYEIDDRNVNKILIVHPDTTLHALAPRGVPHRQPHLPCQDEC
ncbi:La ribonucleoprotein domain member 1 [Saguinus oedipus]|uniref:La ribonucleoprotein domain member 1 n=1 Tax=Saguinus oedipus TaxID=9490 RepID=A0ABQ9U8Y1_SAGOE|nr:La ribonucleoprotein domain member 1 [Saguinus oedipus]